MLKLKKEKILASLIAIVMVALVIGNVYSLATEGNTSTGGTISLTSTGNSSSNKSSNTNISANTDADLGAEVGATNSSRNTNSNTNSSSNTNTNSNTNSSRYGNNTNSSSSSRLPYAGSNTSIIFIVIALGASAIYAYKKVSDYNI